MTDRSNVVGFEDGKDRVLAAKAKRFGLPPGPFIAGVRRAEAQPTEEEKPKVRSGKRNPAFGRGYSGVSKALCPDCQIRLTFDRAGVEICGLCGHGAK